METTQSSFKEPGSIEQPRIIGRIVRFLIGIACLDLVRQIVDDIPGMIERGWPVNFVSVCTILLGFYLLKRVINLGFTLNENYRAQIIVALVTLIIILLEWSLGHLLFSEISTAFLMFWMTYVYGHLGISFALSAIIKTPGCEMRAIPQLWTLMTGRKTLEHHCPGFLNNIDNWEKNLNKRD